jgi:hypothetical protein
VACAAINFWLFRLGFLYGLIGLNLTKHVGVALLCQAIGVNQGPRSAPVSPPSPPRAPHFGFDDPHRA